MFGMRKSDMCGTPPQTISALGTVIMTIMYCHRCGASNPEGTKFCQACRRRVEGYRDPVFYAESASWNRVGNIILFVGLVSVALFILLVALVFLF